MKILVTGASGFIGRFLVRELIRTGHSVSVLLLEAFRDQSILTADLAADLEGVQVVYGDLCNLHETTLALEKTHPRAIIHLAAVGVTDPFLRVKVALQNNVEGTIHLLQAAFGHKTNWEGVEKIIVARTPGELSSMNVYAASKAAAWSFCEMYARTQLWPIVGAMIFQTYGPGQPDHTLVAGAFKAAIAGEDFPATEGHQERDWIFIRDVARALSAILLSEIDPGTTIELGTGRLTAVSEVLGQVFELVGGSNRPLLGAIPNRPGEVERQVADWKRTMDLIGWRAETTLDDGLLEMFNAYQQIT